MEATRDEIYPPTTTTDAPPRRPSRRPGVAAVVVALAVGAVVAYPGGGTGRSAPTPTRSHPAVPLVDSTRGTPAMRSASGSSTRMPETTIAATAMADLTRATRFGRQDQVLFEEALDETGLESDALQAQLDEVTNATQEFLSAFITGVPTLNSVLDGLDPRTNATLDSITREFDEQIDAAERFQANLAVLAARGASDALVFFSTAGPAKGAVALDELLKQGPDGVLQFENLVDTANARSAELNAQKDSLGRRVLTGQIEAQGQSRLDTEAKLDVNLDDFDEAEQDFLIGLSAAGGM